LRALIDAEGRLAVRVTPGARIESLSIAGGQAVAKVRAKPEDGTGFPKRSFGSDDQAALRI
jgi:uncharacterized protein YggU (UPF0235/DUF167 family)